jgi:hypothetical protein
MRKWGVIIGVFLCLIVFFTVRCNSPASSDAAAPFIAGKSNSGSNSGSGGSGNSSGGTTAALGSLTIMMKDKPVQDADQIWVKISNIVVHMADPLEFIEVSSTEQSFDLLELKNNPTALVSADLEAGHYNQIHMDVVEGSIVFHEDNGQGGFNVLTYDLKIPSNEIKMTVQFYIEQSGQAEITLDFDAEESIKVTQQGKKDSYKLRPVIKVVGVSYQ